VAGKITASVAEAEIKIEQCKTYAILMVRTAAGKQQDACRFVVAVLSCKV